MCSIEFSVKVESWSFGSLGFLQLSATFAKVSSFHQRFQVSFIGFCDQQGTPSEVYISMQTFESTFDQEIFVVHGGLTRVWNSEGWYLGKFCLIPRFFGGNTYILHHFSTFAFRFISFCTGFCTSSGLAIFQFYRSRTWPSTTSTHCRSRMIGLVRFSEINVILGKGAP